MDNASQDITEIASEILMETPGIAEGLTFTGMMASTDMTTKAVMLLMIAASIVCWAIIIEKIVIFSRMRKVINNFNSLSVGFNGNIDIFTGFPLKLVYAGVQESRDTAGGESRADYRERVERSMRTVLMSELHLVGKRVNFLATTGSVSPFLGLFGTVWGIIHSLMGIAGSGEASLSVVAPGIAEALFTTAMGLIAAIPAVIAYNKINDTLKWMTKEALVGISNISNTLARIHFSAKESL